MEIEADLIPRDGGRVLVSASTDHAYKPHTGVVWERGSSSAIADMAALHWYAPDDGGEPVFVESSCRAPGANATRSNCGADRELPRPDQVRPGLRDRARPRPGPDRSGPNPVSARFPDAPARERLLALPRESEYVFTTLRGSHYRPSSRSYHWNRVRCAAGFGNVDLYTATRHYFGWYAWNVLELDARDIALHFGHQDGGELVRKLYGHPDAALARECVREAFRQAPTAPIPLAATAS